MEKTTIKKSELVTYITKEGLSRQEVAAKYNVPVNRVNAAINHFGLKGLKKNSAPTEFVDDTVINEVKVETV